MSDTLATDGIFDLLLSGILIYVIISYSLEAVRIALLLMELNNRALVKEVC